MAANKYTSMDDYLNQRAEIARNDGVDDARDSMKTGGVLSYSISSGSRQRASVAKELRYISDNNGYGVNLTEETKRNIEELMKISTEYGSSGFKNNSRDYMGNTEYAAFGMALSNLNAYMDEGRMSVSEYSNMVNQLFSDDILDSVKDDQDHHDFLNLMQSFHDEYEDAPQEHPSRMRYERRDGVNSVSDFKQAYDKAAAGTGAKVYNDYECINPSEQFSDLLSYGKEAKTMFGLSDAQFSEYQTNIRELEDQMSGVGGANVSALAYAMKAALDDKDASMLSKIMDRNFMADVCMGNSTDDTMKVLSELDRRITDSTYHDDAKSRIPKIVSTTQETREINAASYTSKKYTYQTVQKSLVNCGALKNHDGFVKFNGVARYGFDFGTDSNGTLIIDKLKNEMLNNYKESHGSSNYQTYETEVNAAFDDLKNHSKMASDVKSVVITPALAKFYENGSTLGQDLDKAIEDLKNDPEAGKNNSGAQNNGAQNNQSQNNQNQDQNQSQSNQNQSNQNQNQNNQSQSSNENQNQNSNTQNNTQNNAQNNTQSADDKKVYVTDPNLTKYSKEMREHMIISHFEDGADKNYSTYKDFWVADHKYASMYDSAGSNLDQLKKDDPEFAKYAEARKIVQKIRDDFAEADKAIAAGEKVPLTATSVFITTEFKDTSAKINKDGVDSLYGYDKYLKEHNMLPGKDNDGKGETSESGKVIGTVNDPHLTQYSAALREHMIISHFESQKDGNYANYAEFWKADQKYASQYDSAGDNLDSLKASDPEFAKYAEARGWVQKVRDDFAEADKAIAAGQAVPLREGSTFGTEEFKTASAQVDQIGLDDMYGYSKYLNEHAVQLGLPGTNTNAADANDKDKDDGHITKAEVQAIAYGMHSGQFGSGQTRIDTLMAEGYDKADIALAQSALNSGMAFCATMTDDQYHTLCDTFDAHVAATGSVASLPVGTFGSYDGTVPAGATYPNLDDVRTKSPAEGLQNAVADGAPAVAEASVQSNASAAYTVSRSDQEILSKTKLSPSVQKALLQVCQEKNVPVGLALGVIQIESGFNANAVGPAIHSGDGKTYHARGLMQLHDRYYPSKNMSHEDNVRTGVSTLASNYAAYGDWKLALTAYNAGCGAVNKGYRNMNYANKCLNAAKNYGFDIDNPQKSVEVEDSGLEFG